MNENGGLKRNTISFDNVQNNSNSTTNDIFSTSVSGSSTVSEDVNDNLNSDNMSSLNVDNDVSSNNISSDKLDNSNVNNMVDSGINNNYNNIEDETNVKKKVTNTKTIPVNCNSLIQLVRLATTNTPKLVCLKIKQN